METFLGKAQSLIAEFGTLMPIGGTPAEQLTQREKFFVILLLTKLGPEFESIRNQVLGSNIVPGTTELFKRLLQVTSIPGTHTSTTEQSALVTQGGRGRTNNRGGQKNTRVCDYCNRTGHTRDQCWKLHGRPVRTQASVAQSQPGEPNSRTISAAEYEEFVRFKATPKASGLTPAAYTDGTHTALVSQSGLSGPWVIDSGASEHISGPSFGEDDWLGV
ncbi:PREDICTED: uncharacterized protein LOC109157387 [Ipomoea nil]|uniref:uncharacterized protein LOC109157387 n=1 Tax=Ipomoea nil TaxID=35883 RepID=UPI000901C859|nr:PREDICTED: uncharacterized protein LOC109157387 [Ipomoea nil]